MQYYNRSADLTMPLPSFASHENCRDYGYWPITDAPFEYDLRYYTRSLGPAIYNEESDTFSQMWIPVLLPLDNAKHWKQQEFSALFAQLDAQKTRPAAAIAEALALGQTPDPEDVSRLSALNALAKENRVLLQAVMETTIPDDATPDEADAIILQVVEITPLQGETA